MNSDISDIENFFKQGSLENAEKILSGVYTKEETEIVYCKANTVMRLLEMSSIIEKKQEFCKEKEEKKLKK